MRPFSYLPAAACCLLLAFSMSACSGAPAGGSAPSPSPTASAEAAAKEMEGTVNRLDAELDYLVLVGEDGVYYQFSLNGADVSGLGPGDGVAVTYEGEPTGDEPDAKLLSIEKKG